MPDTHLLKGSQTVANPWRIIAKDDEVDAAAISVDETILLPLTQWLAQSEAVAGKANIGVWLDSDESPEPLQPHCQQLALIAINFPAFADGRGYSYARILRDNYGYKSELRAIGDVLRDQLFFYQRCGFDSYLIREDRDAAQAADSLNDFSACYQVGSDDFAPLLVRK